jgi:hypothetical protein
VSGSASPSTQHRDASRPNTSGRSGAVVCAVILTLAHLITAYVTFLAYAAEPAGPWDRETVSHSGFAAGLALAVAAATALPTVLFVKARWLRTWWFVLPAVLATAALLRLTLLAPEL